MTTKRSKRDPVLAFEADMFLVKPQTAKFLFSSATYLVDDPPQSVIEDAERFPDMPTDWFICARWPESCRPDLIRDLSELLGDHPTTISRRLILIGANRTLSDKEYYDFMSARIKERNKEVSVFFMDGGSEEQVFHAKKKFSGVVTV